MSFLERITAERLADAESRATPGAMAAADTAAAQAPAVRDFAGALAAPGLSLIAEIKRASPAKGDIALRADTASIAASYEAAGAAAISVLTEPEYFKGSLDDLSSARGAVTVPVLRKDFIAHPLQILEARAAAADAVLLIAAALTPERLASLIEVASSLDMVADVEVHDGSEVGPALDAGAQVIAVNARNLSTLAVDLSTIERVRPLVPTGIPVIAESGIATREDARRMEDAGVDAIHVGETLMRAADIRATIAMLLGR